jgi:four helix bundle protein
MDNGELRMDNAKPNPVRDKSFLFALRIVKLAKYLQSEKKDFVLSKQVLRSGTAIGALVREAEHAQSKADFVNKMSIALKEANETDYWLDLLNQSDYLTQESYDSIHSDIQELIKLLVSIVKTSKGASHAT